MSEEKNKPIAMGGGKTASPDPDEHCYLLSKDDFHIILASVDKKKLSNWQVGLLSLAITFLYSSITSGALFEFTDSLTKEINKTNFTILIINVSICLGCSIAFLLTLNNKKLNDNLFSRLEKRINDKFGSNE